MDLPDDLTQEVQSETAALVQLTKQPIFAMDNLRTKAKIPLAEVKAIVAHIPTEGDVCHWCKSPLTAEGVVICDKCKRLNFNWK